MATKIPVLVSDISDPMEIIANGKYDYLFEINNVLNLAGTIKELIVNCNKAEVKEKTEQAYFHVCGVFSIKTTAQKYLELYKDLKTLSSGN